MEKDTSEIAKLTERIAKDPKSKLFVPLAEEYKKAGDIDMAIQVLTDGLISNPGYLTARSFLGRLLLDKGDIAGAQKELEEVIKAIPDNLLAQRKLGDIYVIQGRGSDAQQRYKAAFALNPADKELPSLLVDLEAGMDVSSRIPRPKVMASPAAPQAAPAAPAGSARPAVAQVVTPAAQKTAPPVPAPPKAETAPVIPVASKPAAVSVPPSAPKVAVAPTAPVAAPPRPAVPDTPVVPLRDEVEVIEDILEIESLEKPAPAPEIKTPSAAAPVEPLREEPAARAAAAFEAPAFDLSEFGVAASTAAGEVMDASWGTEAVNAPAANAAEAIPSSVDEGGDDLNTNTLAELYISQGFYDKAIEVYQGMLGDRPDNKALQQKLEKLRALAGTAENDIERYATAVPVSGEYIPAEPSVPEEPQPPVAAPVAVPIIVKDEMPADAPAPVETVIEKVVKEAAQENAVTRGPQAATMRRKETIDRLESWLSNIMKEKK